MVRHWSRQRKLQKLHKHLDFSIGKIEKLSLKMQELEKYHSSVIK